MRATPSILLVVSVLALPVLAAGGNRLENPSFDKKGDGPIPKWKVRTMRGRTEFRIEDGVLVAKRSRGGGILEDSCYQIAYLPPHTRAIGFGIRAGCEHAQRVEVVLRYLDRNGNPLGRRAVLVLAGDRKMRVHERDLLLPEKTKDVEVSLVMKGGGRATFDDVSVKAVDETEVRGEALVARCRGAAWVDLAGRTEDTEISIPLPFPTRTQSPLDLEVRTAPSGRLREASFDPDDEFRVLHATLAPGKTLVTWNMRVLLTDREALPESLPISPSRLLPKRVQPLAEPSSEREVTRLAERMTEKSDDLVRLAALAAAHLSRLIGAADAPHDAAAAARAKRGSPAGRARLAAALLRARDVPARAISLLPVALGAGLTCGFEACQKEEGWIRFGLDPEGRFPLPCSGAVLLAREREDGVPGAPTGPAGTRTGLGETEGRTGFADFSCEPVGSFVLPKGTAEDLAESLGKEWEKAARRLKIESGVAEAGVENPGLRGKAKKVKKDLAEILSD